MISYWKIFRNLSSLLRNLTYLSFLNSFLFLSRFSVSLKSLDNYFFRWFAYMSLLSRFSVLISYDMCSSNHFSISSRFRCFSRSRFFRVQVFQGPGFSGTRFLGSGSRVQDPGPGYRSSRLAVHSLKKIQKQPLEVQKQSPNMFRKKRCSYKFRKLHMKTTVLESFLWSCKPPTCKFF